MARKSSLVLTQINIITTRAYAEYCEEILFAFAADTVTLLAAKDEEIFSESPDDLPLWQTVRIQAIFQKKPDTEHLKQTLLHEINEEILLHFTVKEIHYDDWKVFLTQNFPPLYFGKNLSIIPSDKKNIKHKNPEINTLYQVILDPGLAFGTGMHPTTAMCLTWLAENNVNNLEMIDYGCGSGILSLAAIKLGAKKVFAIDHDPQAITATGMNAKKNNIDSKKLSALLPEQLPSIKADLIIANILLKPIITLAPTFKKLLKPNGILLLSGIMKNQWKQLTNSYQSFFNLKIAAENENWILVINNH